MKKITLITFGIVFFITITWLTFTFKFVSWDFRNNLWAPSYLIWHGESAYDIRLLFEDSNSIWFPQIIGLFLPLGLLSQYQAANIWLIQNIVFLLTLIWFLFRQAISGRPKPLHLGVLLLAVFLFPPTVRHLVLGQVDILIVASIITGIYAIKRNQLTLGGFLFAVALTKPQLCVVVLPSLAFYIIFKKKTWLDAVKLFQAICVFSTALTLPLWFSSLHWINDFILNLQRNPNWVQPNIFSILHNRFGLLGVVIWFVLYLGILALSFQIWWKRKPEKAVMWSLALTTFISPYAWTWDFVLLLPLLADTAIRLSNGFARLVLFTFYIISYSLTVINLEIIGALGTALWMFPLILIIGIILSIKIDQKNNVHNEFISTSIFRIDV